MTRLAQRLRRLEARWALQMAYRIETLPPQVILAAHLDCAPEQLPSPEGFSDEMSPEEQQAWDALLARVPVLSPQEHMRALAKSLLTKYSAPYIQRLRRALARYEADHPCTQGRARTVLTG